MITCASCGTTYEPPASGPPYCPNNNCELHLGALGPPSHRVAAENALREAETWKRAVEHAEQHLADVRAKYQAAQAAVMEKLEAAKQAAAAEAKAIAEVAASFRSAKD